MLTPRRAQNRDLPRTASQAPQPLPIAAQSPGLRYTAASRSEVATTTHREGESEDDVEGLRIELPFLGPELALLPLCLWDRRRGGRTGFVQGHDASAVPISPEFILMKR